ncbi:hypothetical protein ED312_02035 [Sinomicrobium pectinilyticum]|uniref:Uncharacterized protein n=1 Tax=Sinomicrobium pectinilyticum TaxID=1084421 RepID=A0A3N0F0E0_SINP1|nr:hypothetical protein [Sinomicrobium pectinilyticum]RNL93427.1 hypothetical protein ED312_02035 [Sinomicrobium pectinilyticum]
MRIFYFFILLVGILSWSSCENDDDSADNVSLTVSADTTMVQVGETITFSVTTNKGDDVTSSSTITINNTVLEENTFTPAQTGTYRVRASFENLITTSHYEVVAVDRKASSIEISSEQTTLSLGEVFSFLVTTDTGVDVTYESVITVGEDTLERERFLPERPGIFSAMATYAGLESAPIEIEVLPNSISVEADKSDILLGESVTFTVFADADIDITSEATILVGEEEIEGNSFTPGETGTYTITATYGEFTSDPVEINVSDNFFVLNDTTYETPTGTFAYFGTFQGENGLESIWAFNPFLEIDNGDGTTGYPNDLYIYIALEQPETGDLVFPSNGTYTYPGGTLPEIFDAQVYYDNNPWVGADESFENITLDITGMETWNNAETTVERIEYTITKEDGSTVTGQYSGPLFAWDASGSRRKKEKTAINIPFIQQGTFSKR